MPTLTAVRKNPWLRAYYERLRARGKLPKVALVAAMRKLLIAVYSVAKSRKPFVPQARGGHAMKKALDGHDGVSHIRWELRSNSLPSHELGPNRFESPQPPA